MEELTIVTAFYNVGRTTRSNENNICLILIFGQE